MSLACPKCYSKACKRNGYTRHGSQNHRCLDCGRQFCSSKALPSSMIIERIEADVLWRSGNKTKHKQWVWIVLDGQGKQVIAFYVDCEMKGAEEVWRLIPDEYRTHARIYTDLEDIFKKLIPESDHGRLHKLNSIRKTLI